ncbi:hypothetical protein PHMEG_00011758 [Phytophthora megakarya]|uniref:Uncharacterized protein n=1 Tax=Phytophthora megakarya TaxID=4795 RepID=A0A225WD14_9STRA|nr:hypothetical protein PHMEG_00011758 [Phytophthora megakarya]
MQRIISRGGAFSVDGSTHEEAKRKTTFLLRHFFTLQDSCASPQAQLLCDVVDGWAVGDHATPDDISRLWKSIDHHIEQSYLLRRKLVAKSDPDEVSVVIAMDCLKQLPQRLPKYRRVLDVIIAVIESGLYLNNAADTALTELPDLSLEDDELPHDRKIPYFEAFRALHNLAHTEEALQLPSSDRSSLKGQDKSSDTSFRQHIESLLGQLENSDEKKGLFRFLLRGNLAMLADLAYEEILNHYLGSRNLESADMFFSLFMQRVSHEEVKRLLTVIARAHSSELQKFALDNIDVLLENESTATGTVTEKKTPALFQRLVDSHPQDFADILWQSPYLTAHVFQGSENLVARVLEQNVYRISQVLTLRGDVLLPLLSHTFKENTTVLEEFLVHHPRGLADLLMNRSSSIAAIVKAKPYILSDILQACHKTLTTVLSSTPEIVSSAIKANPQLLPQIVRDDSSILAAVFATVPQCLGDTLEKRPDFFLDIAHRKPALICRLFAEHPDLLLEPLEANPALFTTFLLYHRNVLPDFNGPGFDPTVYKLRNKQLVEIGVQTINKLNHERRKPRAREKLRVQCEELVESLRAMPGKDASPVATSPETTEVNPEEVIPEDVLSPPQILNEIARLYVAKIASDERDDTMNRKRQSIADFVMELYTLELGFKPVAKKKLVKLLSAAKQVGTVPEAMRIKWFRRFMNAIPGDRPLPQTALDFYLLALQHLIPGGQLALRLEAASLHTCTVSQSTLKAFVDDPLVSRLFDSKEQRQRMLALQNISTSARHDSADTGAKSSVTMLGVLRLDDVLDLVMKFWMQYQLRHVDILRLTTTFSQQILTLRSCCRMRDEWAVVFRSIIPDATGEAHFDGTYNTCRVTSNLIGIGATLTAFSTMVRTKVPGLDNRTLMKIYNSCGEENEHGQFILFSVRNFWYMLSYISLL